MSTQLEHAQTTKISLSTQRSISFILLYAVVFGLVVAHHNLYIRVLRAESELDVATINFRLAQIDSIVKKIYEPWLNAEAGRDEKWAQLNQLREAISPGRLAEQDYYIGVAAKMREKETRIIPTGKVLKGGGK